jgi:hypothetical protein
MSRQHNADLICYWKLSIPATLAGQIEFALLDPVTKKTKYGARNKLVTALLERWTAEQRNTQEDLLPPIPTIEQLRAM